MEGRSGAIRHRNLGCPAIAAAGLTNVIGSRTIAPMTPKIRSKATLILLAAFALAAATWGVKLLIFSPPAAAAPERPPVLGIAHVAFFTSNLRAARHFYGDVLGFDEVFDTHLPETGVEVCFYKVNDHQYVELYAESSGPNQDHLVNIAFETPNVRAMRAYLVSRGAQDVGSVHRLFAGNLGLSLTDPNGHSIQFVEYVPNSVTGRLHGKDEGSRRISDEIIHAGVIVRNRAAEDGLYKNILGFGVMWYGGMTDARTDWVDMRVPNGKNWLEYMLNVNNLSQRTLGVNHHLALGVPSVQAAARTASARGYSPVKPQIGRDGKWQLNLYDPDRTRVELMEPKPVRTPCCSPMHLPD